MTTEIQPFLRDLLIKASGRKASEITLDAILVDDLQLDSLDIVELAIDIENATNVLINDDEMAKAVTVRDLVQFVEQLTDGGKAA